MMRSRFRSVAPFVGAALLISSCGSDSGSATADDWCSFVGQADVVDETFDSLGNDPSGLEDGVKIIESIASDLPDKAPPEIKGPAKVLSDSALQFVKAFEEADFNLLDADLSFLEDQELSDRVEEANAELDAYTERECGRSFGTESTSDGPPADDPADSSTDTDVDGNDDSGFDPSAGTLREQLITQFESIGLSTEESTCIANNLDFNDPAVQSGDIASMLDVFGECGISLERLGELGQG